MSNKPKHFKKPSEQDANDLAYELSNELQDATEKFAQRHECEMSVKIALGAANVYMASWLTHAPSREEALKSLDICADIVRNLIETTPDFFFNHGNLSAN